MGRIRIYQETALEKGGEISLSTSATHHVANVLRSKMGDELFIFNGEGGEYRASIIEISKRLCRVSLNDFLPDDHESPLHIHLGQGLSKGDRMDYAIQKSVELGVSEITPVITDHCTVKINAAQLEKKKQHWQKIIISATEQCGRNRLSVLHPAMPFNEWLTRNDYDTSLMLAPSAKTSIKQISSPGKRIRLLIGPEGGLSDNDITQCQQQQFSKVSLGPRILRTETAACATLAILQALFGDC